MGKFKADQKGFTLIELLTVISIIGILSALGLTSFSVYRSSAAYGVANKTLRDGVTALEASLNNVDDPPGAVGLTTQSSQGPIQDPRAAELLPGMMVPRLTKFAVSYDPTCEDSSCEMSSMQVNHCQGEEYIRYVRFGDGLGVWLEHLAGDGCA